MTTIPQGSDFPLNGSKVAVALAWTGAQHDVDLCGLLLGADGQVRGSEDFVFYNQPDHPTGSMIHRGRAVTVETIEVDTARIPDDVETIMLIASLGDGTFAGVTQLALTVTSTAGDDLRFDSTCDADAKVLIIAEACRRAGAWRLREVGRGWTPGLADLVTHFGVVVDDRAAAAPISQPPSLTPGPDRVQAVASAPPVTAPSSPVAGTPRSAVDLPPAEAPVVPTAHGVPAVVVPRKVIRPTEVPSQTLDSAPVSLAVGDSCTLTRAGRTPDQLWLRVTHTGAAAVGADVSVVAFDEVGTPTGVIHYGEMADVTGAVRLINLPTSTASERTAGVDLRLDLLAPETVGLVVSASSYQGHRLDGLTSLVTELVVLDGSTAVRAECPVPSSTAVVLARLVRDRAGRWVLTAQAAGVEGRTPRSLVGAGRWALDS